MEIASEKIKGMISGQIDAGDDVSYKNIWNYQEGCLHIRASVCLCVRVLIFVCTLTH